MTSLKKAVLNWSGGKDAALALHKILKEASFEVVALLTTINEEDLRSSVHSIPLRILSLQARSIGIPLHTVVLPKDLKGYTEKMRTTVAHFKDQGVTHFIFGDILLSDVKRYRESLLHPYGIEVVEPLWNKTPEEVITDFLNSGIKAKIIVTQADKLGRNYIGRDLDRELIASLPPGVDLCGENGEYHTLAYAGDLFKEKIGFSIGAVRQLSRHIQLDTGEIKAFEYFQAEITGDDRK